MSRWRIRQLGDGGRGRPTLRVVLGLSIALGCVGCAAAPKRVVEAFPIARVASPWVLQDAVWEGTLDECRLQLGRDAKTWAEYHPAHIWLARYCHEDKPARCLTVRLFAFESPAEAQQAYEAFAPLLAKPFGSGDVGCWTEIGVLFRWGRLVCDIFGDKASWNCEVQSAVLAAFITKRMPPGAPDHPQ